MPQENVVVHNFLLPFMLQPCIRLSGLIQVSQKGLVVNRCVALCGKVGMLTDDLQPKVMSAISWRVRTCPGPQAQAGSPSRSALGSEPSDSRRGICGDAGTQRLAVAVAGEDLCNAGGETGWVALGRRIIDGLRTACLQQGRSVAPRWRRSNPNPRTPAQSAWTDGQGDDSGSTRSSGTLQSTALAAGTGSARSSSGGYLAQGAGRNEQQGSAGMKSAIRLGTGRSRAMDCPVSPELKVAPRTARPTIDGHAQAGCLLMARDQDGSV